MSPNATSERRSSGENGDEPEGIGTGGGAGAGQEQGVEIGGRRRADEAGIPPDQAPVEEVPRGRGGGTKAPQRRAAIEPRVRGAVPAEGIEVSGGEVWRASGRAFRSDAGGRASGL